MLRHLHIRDYVIAHDVELEFGSGMSAITGETGAGKSILIDALGILLGDRAESSCVRQGAERAELSAGFSIAACAAAQAWLQERDLDLDGECHLRRVISGEGRSRAYINGSPQPLQALRELGELLLEIHGQHEHQRLVRREAQRALLDGHAEAEALAQEVRQAHARWSDLTERLQDLERGAAEREARLDLLRFQRDELQALSLSVEGWKELEQEHLRLSNAGRLIEGGQRALAMLYSDEPGCAYSLLARAGSELEALAESDSRLAEISALLDTATVQAREASDALRRYVERIEVDPGALEQAEQRIGAAHALARKHRCFPEQLPERLAALEAECAALDDPTQDPDRLRAELAAARERYTALAGELSLRRQDAAIRLGEAITASMQTLGMTGGRFAVEVSTPPQAAPRPHGDDDIEFLVSANPGQPLRALGKVASGGELSRISLAIQVITAARDGIATLIFDEVDTGIGGATAEVVGRLLRALGEERQVLCVTHLPQVAAQAHQQFRVSKHAVNGTTQAGIEALTGESRVTEIARMLGGVELTDSTLAHAREMISRAVTA